MCRRAVPQHRGFTYVELLIVILIIAGVIAVVAPILYRVRQQQARAACENNLKEIGLAIHNYAGEHNSILPPMLAFLPEPGGRWEPGQPQPHGWAPFFFSLYPYLGQQPLYAKSVNSGAAWNNDVHSSIVPSLLCPADPSGDAGLCSAGAEGWAGASYAPSYQMFGERDFVSDGRRVCCSKYKIGNIPDGTSNTIGVVERFNSFPEYNWSNAAVYPQGGPGGWNSRGAVYGVWGPNLPQIMPPLTKADPWTIAANPYHPNTGHRECMVLLMDGSVRPITAQISNETWKWAVDPCDTTPFPAHWE